MAWVFSVNQSEPFVTVHQIIINLKDAMVASGGWTVESSGQGNSGTYNASGDDWGSLAANLSYGAWIRLQHTSGLELLFQMYHSSWHPEYWSISLSPSAGFTGGSPDKDTKPTATDEAWLWSQGGAPNLPAVMFSSSTQRYHIITEDTAPYRWFLGSGTSGSGALYTGVFFEGLKSGSYPATNLLPYIIGTGYLASADYPYSYCFHTSTSPRQHTVVRSGEADEVVQQVWSPKQTMNSQTAWPCTAGGAPGDNPYTGDADTLGLTWMVPASQAGAAGFVGISSTFLGLLSYRVRADTFNIDGGTKNWALWGTGVLLPWDGSDMLM